MSFIETEASYRIEVINGKPVKVITPKTEVTITNVKTGQEYNSDAEGDADVNDPNTATKREHLKRDVVIKIKRFPSILSKSGDL